MAKAKLNAKSECPWGMGASKSAVKRRVLRERGTLHIGGGAGYEFAIGKAEYVVARDGSFRRKVAA